MSMNTGAWLVLSLRRGFATAREIAPSVAAATLVLCLVLTPIVVLSGLVAEQRSSPSALTQIEVSPGGGAGDMLLLDDLEALQQVPGVTGVVPLARGAFYSGSDSAWDVSATAINPANLPPDVPAQVAEAVAGRAVILPATVNSVDLSGLSGQSIEVEMTEMTGPGQGHLVPETVQVAALYDPAWEGAGPSAALVSQEFLYELLARRGGLSVEDHLRTVGIDAVLVTAQSEDSVDAVRAQVRELGLVAVPVTEMLGTLPGIFAVFLQVLAVAGIGATALLLIQIRRSVAGSVQRREAELGLLRTRGWSTAQVRRLLAVDVLLGSGVAACLGGLLGTAAGAGLVLGLTPEVSPQWFLPLALAIPGVIVVVTGVSVLASHWALRRSLAVDPFLVLMARER